MPVSSTQGLDGLRSRLRHMILTGELAPGSAISQVRLSQELAVSRTPLREALRMLQQEGLIVATPNRRSRIAQFNLVDLEYVYTQRLLLESLGVMLTAQARKCDGIEVALVELRQANNSTEADVWQTAHERFHRELVADAPDLLKEDIYRLQERATNYRRLYSQGLDALTARRPAGMRDHEGIAVACRDGDPPLAAQRLAKHFARTALTLMAEYAPEYQPTVVREALQLIVRAEPGRDSAAAAPDTPGRCLPGDHDGQAPQPGMTGTGSET